MALSEQGAFARADEVAAEAREMSEEVRYPDTLVHGLFAIGSGRGLRGDVATATAPLERALAIIEETEMAFYAPWAKSLIGNVYVTAGRAVDAVKILESGIRDAEAGHIRCIYARLLIGLGYAHALARQVTQARASAESGLREVIETGERGHEAYARHLLGLVLGLEGNAEQSAHSLNEALALATELGMRPLVAHCHLGLGKLYRRAGKHQEVQANLVTATTMYREMDMRFWLEQGERELKNAG
jgi:tetratricopeptide (TPR) repeat protein